MVLTTVQEVSGQVLQHYRLVGYVGKLPQAQLNNRYQKLIIGDSVSAGTLVRFPDTTSRGLFVNQGAYYWLKANPFGLPDKIERVKPITIQPQYPEQSVAYLMANMQSQVYWICNRLTFHFSISKFPTDGFNGFMQAIQLPKGDKMVQKKRCNIWGDSLVMDKRIFDLKEVPDSVVQSQLYHYDKNEAFYNFIGNVWLVDSISVVRNLKQTAQIFVKEGSRQQKQKLAEVLYWQYPGLTKNQAEVLIRDVLVGRKSAQSVSSKRISKKTNKK